nr:ATP dependent RNA helicase DDX51 [Hymenolepis microstoma]
MDLNEAESARESKSADRDNVIGGFTIVRDKLRYTAPKVKKVLPYWITNPVRCSETLEKGVKIKEFHRFDRVLLRNLKRMGIKRFFPIQNSVIPYILDFYEGKCQNYVGQPRDICISAPTGSGKTLSYALPILQLLSTCKTKLIRCVVILPVRDLAKQVAETFRLLAENTSLRIALLTGEESFTLEQESIFKKQGGHVLLPDIIVCTPGRLVDHIYNTPNFCLEHVRFLIIDEADRIITEEKQDWFNIFEGAIYGAALLSDSKENLKRSFPLPTIEAQTATTHFTLQKILLSATLTHDPEPLKRFRLNFPRLFLAIGKPEGPIINGLYNEGNDFKEPLPTSSEQELDTPKYQRKKADLNENKENTSEPLDDTGGVGVFSTPSGLKEFFVELVERQKPIFLVHLVKKLGHQRILCFTNSREESKRLAAVLNHFDGIRAGALNAGMPLQKRTRLLSAFANGEYQLLICTDAVARGIDVKNISCVVSYKAPQSVKTYVHRIGRTARAGKSGEAYTLLNHNQIRYFKSSLKSVGKHAKNFPIHSSKLRPYEKDYKAALAELEKEYKAKPKDAFGVAKPPEEINGRRKRELNEKVDIMSKKSKLETGEQININKDE